MSWDYYLIVTATGKIEKVKASSAKLLELQPNIAAGKIRVLWSDGHDVFEYRTGSEEWEPI